MNEQPNNSPQGSEPTNEPTPTVPQPSNQAQTTTHASSVSNPTPTQSPTQNKQPMSGMAIAGLVMGIIAVFSSIVPLLNILSFPFVILGVIFSVVGIVGTGKNKKSGRPIAIVALVISVLALIITVAMYAGAAGTASNTNANTNTNTSAATSTTNTANEADAAHASDSIYELSNKKLETVEEPTMVLEYNYPKVSGTLKNISGKKLTYVQIEVNFYDASGAQIGNTLANTNNLENGGTWKYTATGFTANPASYKITSVTAY